MTKVEPFFGFAIKKFCHQFRKAASAAGRSCITQRGFFTQTRPQSPMAERLARLYGTEEDK
jgi:hypothetical protein